MNSTIIGSLEPAVTEKGVRRFSPWASLLSPWATLWICTTWSSLVLSESPALSRLVLAGKLWSIKGRCF